MARADHIFVIRYNGLYGHHGIDCGDGTVIHYTSPGWREQRRIERTALDDFCRGDELQLRDYGEFQRTLQQKAPAYKLLNRAARNYYRMLDTLRGLSPEELDHSDDAVIKRAESRLGESSFDLVSNNCEHFAAWCKTGISSSSQIEAVWRASLSGPAFLGRRTQLRMIDIFENSRRR